MPDKPTLTVYADGIHDDTEALQAWQEGKVKLVFPDGTPFREPWKGLILPGLEE